MPFRRRPACPDRPHADPQRPRRRRVGAVVGCGLAVVMASSALPGQAATPEERRRDVLQQLRETRQDLHEDSAELAAATVRFQAADAQLRVAQTALARAQGQVVAARAKAEAARAALAAAEEALAASERRVAVVSERIADQHERVGRLAAQAYRGGGISEIGFALTNSADPVALSDGLSAVASVVRSEDAVADDLADDRAGLATERAKNDGLRDAAAEARAQAVVWLRRTRELEAAAAQRRRQVAELVTERRAAMAAAQRAKAADLARYRALQRQRERINALIAERIRKERERRARLARLQAARDQAARARANRRAAAAAPAERAAVRPASTALLQWPIPGAPITSPYGMRVHPVTGVYKLHDGTDFGASCGTPVRAARGGSVVWATSQGAYGNQVLVDSGWVAGESLMTSYSHLSGFAVGDGQRVGTGQVIGYVGSTGYSTGCHLHFMVYRDGDTVDPMRYL